jgi:para-aminobenzoate synthetase component I
VSIADFAETVNGLGAQAKPFLFLVDFEMKRPMVFTLEEIEVNKILYEINGNTNASVVAVEGTKLNLSKFPITFNSYKDKFDSVRSHIAYGDSYLTNLTIKTRINSLLSLKEMFAVSRARYKLLYKDRFLVFSPETFVKIEDGKIYAYPMKGTIDAGVPEASEKILADGKEMAEHVTIVDLLRNDLSAVATNVHVTRFRYLEEIRTTEKNLLQVSSEIVGHLPDGYESKLGDIVLGLLPAGSVTGAPKLKTVTIIREAENEPRGYYTGVVGLFDGSVLDTGVMIRFIENDGGTLYYRSGGGITIQSNPEAEYQEAIDKVYVPID